MWWASGNTASIAPIRSLTTPAGLFDELEQDATGRLSDEAFSVDSLGREDAVGAMAAYLLARYRPTLMLVHIIASTTCGTALASTTLGPPSRFRCRSGLIESGCRASGWRGISGRGSGKAGEQQS